MKSTSPDILPRSPLSPLMRDIQPEIMDMKGLLKALLNTLFIIVNNVYCIPTYLLWMLTLRPLLYISASTYWWIEGLFFNCLLTMVSNWLWMAGYHIAEVGDDISECFNEECVVLANHQSTGDVVTLMKSLMNKGNTCNNVLWIMDYIFKFTNFGWVSQIHGDFFLQQGREHRDTQLKHLEEHLRNVYLPRGRNWIFLFPEGGFLRKRRESSQKYARKNNYPVLEHVTLPRMGAMHTLLKTLTPSKSVANGDAHSAVSKDHHLKWVIDITIGYPEKRPLDVFQVLWRTRGSCTTTLYNRKYPISEVPLEEEKLQKWMYDRFEEKDNMLENFYTTGKFDINEKYHSPSQHDQIVKKPKQIDLDGLKIWSLHAVFLMSSYMHYHLLSSTWSWITGLF